MVKPSLKTTSFKHHPMYIQKALHVDNPFYGPKPQYQRAEVITGGDCEDVENGDWGNDAGGFVQTALGAGDQRVGDSSMLMTQTGLATDGSIYLLLDGPIDLSWAKFVGFWYKGQDGEAYLANDIYLYIFTKASNYAYANRARRVDPFGAYNEEGTGVWHYAEVDIGDFDIASGYEGDKLDEVWGIGFCSHGLETQTMQIDQIEFYTIGTGKGPARGLIESAPLYDNVHAERGYGLAWNEYSGRIDVSEVANDGIEPAFAGICVGNPSRTRLSQDVTGGTDTILHVVDASLLRPGVVTIHDTATLEAETITAVNIIEKTITLDTAPNASFTVARNAFVCMEGNEEGTIRVDFVVDGIVNVIAAEANIRQGYGVKCQAIGSALTVKEDDVDEEGNTIGKALENAVNVEVFPIKLMTDARTA